jgi:hypothetical protein
LKEWTTPDSQSTPSTTKLKEEETMDTPGNDGNASMPEQFKRLNPWRKMMMNYDNIFEIKTTNKMYFSRVNVPVHHCVLLAYHHERIKRMPVIILTKH